MSRKFRVCFHTAPLNLKRKHLISNVIRLWTGIFNWGTPPVSHVEIWVPNQRDSSEIFKKDDEYFELSYCDEMSESFYGTMYTSTMRDKENGTVKRPASQVLTHPERWTWMEFELESDKDWYYLMSWMNDQVDTNKGYSFRDCLKFIGLGILADKHKNICSEFVHNALAMANVIDDGEFKVVSPRRLWRILQKIK